MAYWLIKGERAGGVAFWRSILAVLKEDVKSFKVKKLKLHEKANMYIFPKDVFKDKPWQCYTMELNDFNIVRWDSEDLEVEVQEKTVGQFFPYKVRFLVVKSKEGSFTVTPSGRFKV